MDELRLYAQAMPLVFTLSGATSFFTLRVLPRLSAHGIKRDLACGIGFHGLKDIPRAKVKEARMEKPLRPEIGGEAVTAGLLLGLFSSIGFISYSGIALARLPLLGGALTLLLVSFVSLADDLHLSLRQQLKPLTLPVAGLFLAFIEAGELTGGPAVQASTVIALPLILIPVGIAGASHLTNRLEASGDLWMGTVAVVSLGVIAFLRGELSALLVLVSGFGVLLAALYYGFSRPAKELIGDIGTYGIGALIAISAIIGGFALAAVIVLIPYLLNLGLRARGRSLAQLIGGFSGRALVPGLIGVEAVFGLIAVLLYARFW